MSEATPLENRSWLRQRFNLGLRRGSFRAADEEVKHMDSPASGTVLSDRMTLFHDAVVGNFTCVRKARPLLRLTAYQFDGSYFSLAVRLRKADLRDVRAGCRAKVCLDANASRPVTVYLRLNARTPEKTDTLYDTVVVHRDAHEVSFDLDGLRGGFEQLESAWLDLIISEPEMSEVEISALDVQIGPAGE